MDIPIADRETWRHLETRQGTGWFNPSVVTLECPRGHRLELPQREALKDFPNAMAGRQLDPRDRSVERDFEAWILCPDCGCSYPWVLHMVGPED